MLIEVHSLYPRECRICAETEYLTYLLQYNDACKDTMYSGYPEESVTHSLNRCLSYK